jgi:putative restriction endonuclease
MTNQEIINAFDQIKSWTKGSERAPHKPLLILIVLGEIQNGNTHFIKFEEIEERLRNLLIDFGPPIKNAKPHYPFVRLANDGIWEFNKPKLIDTTSDPSSQYLIENEISACFIPEIKQRLINDPLFLKEVAWQILSKNFPESIHEDILSATGLDISPGKKRTRNAAFRDQILIAYEYKCAVCEFSVRLAQKNIALEAAHIKWFEAQGPDTENNGIALCTMHHKLFDLGAFTLKNNLIFVSDHVNGTGAKEWLLRFHGKEIRLPQREKYYPKPEFTEWHVNEVFKGMEREV